MTTECQPVAPSGKGSRRTSVLDDSVAIGRPDLESMAAGRGLPVERPLAPGVDGVDGGEAGRLPRAVVDADLDRVDAAVLGPGDAADDRPAGRDRRQRLGRVDARHRLDRRFRRPAALDPVRVVGVEGRSAPARPATSSPTRSRTGRARPCGPGSRSRPAAARRSCRRPASRRDRRGRRRSACRWSSRRSSARPAGRLRPADAGQLEHGRQRDAEPAGVADVRPADLVRDAGQGDVALDRRELEELGERQA